MTYLLWAIVATNLFVVTVFLIHGWSIIVTHLTARARQAAARRHTQRWTMAHPIARPGASMPGRRAS